MGNCYALDTTVWSEDAVVGFEASERIFDYFVSDNPDGRFLEYRKPHAIADKGYTKANIIKTDYIRAVPSVPILSTRAIEVFGDRLRDDADIEDCIVRCGDEEFLFHILRINRRIEGLIDKSRTEYRKRRDYEIPWFLVYNPNIQEPFMLAKDAERITYWVASEAFRELALKNKLKISFRALRV
ncbi:MAG: hypothetical protein ABSB75_07890 [Candidatus Limnocylindrales bacterium]